MRSKGTLFFFVLSCQQRQHKTMMAFPRLAVSQVLVRRHRTRDGQEDASPAPASSNGNANDEGVDEEAPSSARRDVDRSNANNNSSTSTTGGNLSTGESHDGEQELVVQVPNSWQQSASIPPSFVFPPMAWEPSEEATALRREAIHREVRRFSCKFVSFAWRWICRKS